MSFRILLVVTWVYQYITKSILTHVKNFSNQPHTITFTDFKIDCNDVIAQYIKFNNLKQNWVWDNKILQLTSVAPHIIDLTRLLPTIKTIYLSEGKFEDPQFKAMESLAHVQQTSKSVPSLVKLLNNQLTWVEGIDECAIASAAEDAGVHSQNYFSFLAHKSADAFLPSPWSIILILILSIALLILLLMMKDKCSSRNGIAYNYTDVIGSEKS